MTNALHDKLPFGKLEIEESIVARWQRIVERFPQQVAITMPDGAQQCYGQVDRHANQLAHCLLARLGPENSPVALLIDHSPALVVAIVGLLKANKAYVVLDANQPAEQLSALITAIAPVAIVTTDEQRSLAHTLLTTTDMTNPVEIFSMDELTGDELAGDGLAGAEVAPDLAIAPDALAALFFTSGTSGNPKGVIYTHRMILHRIWVETELYQLTATQRISGLRMYNMAAGLRDLFNALLNGGTLCLYPPRQYGLNELSAWLLAQKITYFHLPILLYRAWLDTLSPQVHFPDIQYIFPSGRKSATDCQRLWPHVASTARLVSTYATTESSLLTMTMLNGHSATEADLLSVGYPTPDKTIMLVDEVGQPVQPGAVGEIVVESRYNAPGYWQQPALTAQRFIILDDGETPCIRYATGDMGRWRADGSLELVGRRDSQVKLRGYRVVLDEVEDALRALPNIQDAVVTADEERGLLQAYLVAATEPPPSPVTLRAALATRLPDYALPTHISYLASLPLLPSGKVDRNALPAPAQSRPALATAYTPPRTAQETGLVAIWEELLEIQPVGIHDHFFDLGGNSLRAMRLVVEVERQLGARLSLVDFFQQPTIAALTHALQLGVLEASMPSRDITEAFSPATWGAAHQEQAELLRIYGQLGQVDGRQSWRKSHQTEWHRRRKTIRFALGLLPYRWSIKLLRWFVRQSWVQKRFYRQQISSLERFWATIEHNHDRAKTIAHHLLCGCINHYHLEPLGDRAKNRATDYAAQWLTTSGMEVVEQAIAQQRGVILLRSHDNGAYFFSMLPFKSYRVGQIERHLAAELRNDAIVERTLFTQQLNSARLVLERGGIVNLSADNWFGVTGSVTRPLHGRGHSFFPHFAELAVLTGATVIIVDVALDCDGRAHITFVGPLDNGHVQMPSATRVDHLLAQYVTFWQTVWAEKPWQIPWYELIWHWEAPGQELRYES